MEKKKFLRSATEYIIKFFGVYIPYSAVLIYILSPMLILGGFLFFLLYPWSYSWYLADPSVVFERHITKVWLNTVLYIPSITNSDLYQFIYLSIKLSVFIFGLILFAISLFQLVNGLKKERALVKTGIYKHIRHPQNLGIILMALPLFLYYGIRMGSIVSWAQFVYIIIIYSDLGDIKLKKKYPEQFDSYFEQTGFMVPRIVSFRISKYYSAIYNKKVRYPLIIGLYILTVFTFYQIYLFLPFVHIYI